MEVDGYEVTTYISFQTTTQMSCRCDKNYSCEHEVAVRYYAEKHPEIFKKDEKVNINLIDSEKLKNFIENEMEENPDFKRRFLEEFSKNPEIDRKKYYNHLYEIFEYGKDKNYDIAGVYNIDIMEHALISFMNDEIVELLNIGEHDFACELLTEIAIILNDDLAMSYDSWYDVAEELVECEYILYDSITLSKKQMDVLQANISEIHNVL